MRKKKIMGFKDLNYKEKISVAEVFYKETMVKTDIKECQPDKIYMSFNKFIFETKAGGAIECKIEDVKKFFEKNTTILRKAKLFEINKNLS